MTTALIDTLFHILSALISLTILVIFVWVILSWLVLFQVVNLRNPFVRQVSDFLDAFMRPLLRPLRRFIPLIGGFDITPVILIIVLGAVNDYLLPDLNRVFDNALGGV
jgi:YggT family protein